jgi:hypothetical protein
MKKVLFLVMATAWLLTSCDTKRWGTDEDGLFWFVKDYTIKSNQWVLVNDGNHLEPFYQAEIKVSALNRDIYNRGNVFCYMYQIINGVEVQTLLPYSVPRRERKDNEEFLWTETFACDFAPGSIMFYVHLSDFFMDNPPQTTKFRVVLNN